MARTMTATMKAVFIRSFGGSEALHVGQMPVPEPHADEVLVRIHAAGVNPVDWKIREGYFGARRLPSILGRDFSGVVEAVGTDVSDFHAGDPVFGVVADSSGSYAQYAVAPIARVAKKPESLDFVQAAALPVASLTAWQALFDMAHIRAGQRVLIHAAAGGVGSFAVQLAHWKGCHTIATASSESADLVRQLGANEVINYRTTRFEEAVRDVDVVVDTIGGETQVRSWNVLKAGGILISVVQPPSQEEAAARGFRAVFLVEQPQADQLTEIAGLVVRGQIKVPLAASLPLEQAGKALELSQGGHVHGKIVLAMDTSSP